MGHFAGDWNGTVEIASAFGKSAGISVRDTFPVAAHSVPRRKVSLKPAHDFFLAVDVHIRAV